MQPDAPSGSRRRFSSSQSPRRISESYSESHLHRRLSDKSSHERRRPSLEYSVSHNYSDAYGRSFRQSSYSRPHSSEENRSRQPSQEHSVGRSDDGRRTFSGGNRSGREYSQGRYYPSRSSSRSSHYHRVYSPSRRRSNDERRSDDEEKRVGDRIGDGRYRMERTGSRFNSFSPTNSPRSQLCEEAPDPLQTGSFVLTPVPSKKSEFSDVHPKEEDREMNMPRFDSSGRKSIETHKPVSNVSLPKPSHLTCSPREPSPLMRKSSPISTVSNDNGIKQQQEEEPLPLDVSRQYILKYSIVESCRLSYYVKN